MDPGRYVPRQGWDSNSALEGYGGTHERDFRTGGLYGNRRFLDDGFPKKTAYSRSTGVNRDMLNREVYGPSPPVSAIGPYTRIFDDESTLIRQPKTHVEPFHDMENYHHQRKYQDNNSFHYMDRYRDNCRPIDGYHDLCDYRDDEFDENARRRDRDHADILRDQHKFLNKIGRETSREEDYDYGRYSYDSDNERSRRDNSRRRESRDREREKKVLSREREKKDSSRERDRSPYNQHDRSLSRGRRSHSHGCQNRSRSRSPRGQRRGRSHREDSYDDCRYERSEKRWDHDRYNESSVRPSATVVVKGISQETTEEDLSQILADWGPLRHVRIIKDRTSGVSRGFAFIDFPTVKAACSMMDSIGEDGLLISGKQLFFEYSSKPTGLAGASSGSESVKPNHGYSNSSVPPSDWLCTMCGCVNFARRTSCFQCNEGRTDDAPPADLATSNSGPSGKKGSESGPTHVLVVRGLDENADENMLRYEFSKHAPIKDIRLIRDKFTHLSRGFAFVHFNLVEDATKALEATNGTPLEKNGQALRVAYAKSIYGPGSGAPQSSNIAAAAIEAATFAQQYDAVGWRPKEFNPGEEQLTGGLEQTGNVEAQKNGTALQSGFVWDEKSGYYYDAASGFYYDGNTGLYYDGNNGIWYSLDPQTQQYIPCTDQSNTKISGESANETSKASESLSSKKVVISAPATSIKSNEKTSLPDAIQAAATAALAAEKKEKERLKEIRLASKTSLLANKKKMNNVLTMWKQRNSEGQASVVVVDDPSKTIDDKHGPKTKLKSDFASSRESIADTGYGSSSFGREACISPTAVSTQTTNTDSQINPRPVSNNFGGAIQGVIRGSGQGGIKADTAYAGSSNVNTIAAPTASTSALETSLVNPEMPNVVTPFKTDASALGLYPQPVPTGSGKRRFSEMPVQSTTHREQHQTIYRDRAAERRSLHRSSLSIGDDLSDIVPGDSNRDPYRNGSALESGAMPFPPGVGGERASVDTESNAESYEVITADHAIDESNVGNRMLRSMGWKEGLGLGKDGSGIVEPVQAEAAERRLGLGSQKKRKVDPALAPRPGDSYRTKIQKKAIARFREIS